MTTVIILNLIINTAFLGVIAHLSIVTILKDRATKRELEKLALERAKKLEALKKSEFFTKFA